jgi:hypothetical protein
MFTISKESQYLRSPHDVGRLRRGYSAAKIKIQELEMRMRPRIAAIVVASGVILGWSSLGFAQQIGPGPHWVDTVPAATVSFDGVVYLEIGGISAQFQGPTTVQLSGAIDDSVFFPGLRPVDSHLDVVDTEVMTMNMAGTNASTGWTLLAGINSGLSNRTLGAMAESTTDSAVAQSFFDVFFEIQGTPWGTLHNDTPLYIDGLTYKLPPIGSVYTVENAPIALYDSNGNLAPVFITGGVKIIPEPSTLLLVVGALGFLGLSHRWRK